MEKYPVQILPPVNRRDFLKSVFGMIAGYLIFMITWPLFAFLTSSFSNKEDEDQFVKVPDFVSIPEGEPTKMMFQYVHRDAFLQKNEFLDLWVIKHSSTEVTVFSPLCTHLSCRYDWRKDQEEFVCPCHASVFDPKGQVVAGPAPRPLDVLPYKIEGGELYIKWKVYKPGISRKIEV
jgi:menaquinol-cytochrome c reductase iron-sulfur subunit